jgi:surface protein
MGYEQGEEYTIYVHEHKFTWTISSKNKEMRSLFEFLSTNVKPNIIYATDDTIKKIVKDELDKLGHDADLNHIDVSKVTNMNSLFSCADGDLGKKYTDLNPNISKWDVSNVTIMSFMFFDCENFNQVLSKWDVSKIRYMDYIFYNCENFNQDLSGWNVGKVENMKSMFSGCKNFNKDLSQWDVSEVKIMWFMFDKCEKFNQDLSKWNVSEVTDMSVMFRGCKNFNQDLSGWDVSKVKNINYMFDDCPIKEEFKPKFK